MKNMFILWYKDRCGLYNFFNDYFIKHLKFY